MVETSDEGDPKAESRTRRTATLTEGTNPELAVEAKAHGRSQGRPGQKNCHVQNLAGTSDEGAQKAAYQTRGTAKRTEGTYREHAA